MNNSNPANWIGKSMTAIAQIWEENGINRVKVVQIVNIPWGGSKILIGDPLSRDTLSLMKPLADNFENVCQKDKYEYKADDKNNTPKEERLAGIKGT